MTPWLVIVIAVLIVLLGIVFAMRMRKGKMPPTDYFGWFVIGVVWAIAGIVGMIFSGRDQSFFLIMGLAFAIGGWVRRDKWKENRKQWKGKRIIAAIVLGALMAAFIVIAMMRG